MRQLFNIIIFIAVGVLLVSINSCQDEYKEDRVVMGMRPIYSPIETDSVIVLPSIEIVDYDKVIYKVPYVYYLFKSKGIQLVRNNELDEFTILYFISIPNIIDCVVEDNLIIVLTNSEIITLLYDEKSIEIIDIKQHLTQNSIQHYPNVNRSTYFECVDPEKGFVYDWEESELINPKCRK